VTADDGDLAGEPLVLDVDPVERPHRLLEPRGAEVVRVVVRVVQDVEPGRAKICGI
jgi:hypothetical protein